MKINPRSLEMMENAFSDYLSDNINSQTLTKKIGTILTNTEIGKGSKSFEVDIVKNKHGEPFFGMRIVPIITHLEDIVKEMVVEKESFRELVNKWRSIDKWYLEIDNNVFDRNVINFNPKELVAMILHEIGHVIYSEKPLATFYRAYQESYIKLKLADKASIKVLYQLYTIPLSVACMTSNVVNRNELKIEKFADSLLLENGCTEFLISAFEKIIKAHGNTIQKASKSDFDEISNSVQWVNLNIKDMNKRQKKMRDDLYYMTIKNGSGFMKALAYKILKTFGLKLRENYTGAVVEASFEYLTTTEGLYQSHSMDFDMQTMNNIMLRLDRARYAAESEIVMEAKAGRRRKVKFPSRYDIDSISVEIDKITNHHDRIYVLDLIYDKIEKLEYYRELSEIDNDIKRRYLEQIDPMVRDLEILRQRVLDKKILGAKYKLFVKVPEGYEG